MVDALWVVLLLCDMVPCYGFCFVFDGIGSLLWFQFLHRYMRFWDVRYPYYRFKRLANMVCVHVPSFIRLMELLEYGIIGDGIECLVQCQRPPGCHSRWMQPYVFVVELLVKVLHFLFPIGDLRYLGHGSNGYVVVLTGRGFADPARIVRFVEPLDVDHQKRFLWIVRAEEHVRTNPYAKSY